MKKLLAFTCLLAAPLAAAGVAGAGGGSGTLSLSPETVAVSQSFSATYEGCASGDLVLFSIDGVTAAARAVTEWR